MFLLWLLALLLPVKTVEAHPESLSGCSTWTWGASGFSAQCDSGTTYYRAKAQCYGAAGFRYSYGTIVAPSPARSSNGQCDVGYHPISVTWIAVT